MNEYLIKELDGERKELGIETRAFAKMIALAEIYQLNNYQVTEEELAVIVRETMNNYDYALQDSDMENGNELDEKEIKTAYHRRKSIEDCFELALINLGYKERNERKF